MSAARAQDLECQQVQAKLKKYANFSLKDDKSFYKKTHFMLEKYLDNNGQEIFFET